MVRPKLSPLFAALVVTLCVGNARAQVNVDNIPIHRLVLEIETCDVNNAGTDDKVWLSVNGGTEVALNHGSERNREDVDEYDILPFVPTNMATFSSFRIRKDGTDRWDICSLALHANDVGTPIFAVGAFSLNGNGGLLNSRLFSSLRGPAWTNASSAMLALPMSIASDDLASMLEIVIGNRLAASSRMSWGDRDGPAHVQVNPYAGNVFHVDYDLRDRNAGQHGLGREVDYDERYVVECVNGLVRVTRVFSDVDCPGIQCEITDAGYTSLQSGINRSFAAIQQLGRQCSGVFVDGAGNIQIVP